jgi:hypothetical protein
MILNSETYAMKSRIRDAEGRVMVGPSRRRFAELRTMASALCAALGWGGAEWDGG